MPDTSGSLTGMTPAGKGDSLLMKILTVVLAAAALALGIWGFNQQARVRDLTARLNAAEERANAAETKTTSVNAQLSEARATLAKVEEKAAEAASGASAAEVAGKPVAAGKKKDPMADMGKSIGEMMKNPAMKDMMATQVRGMIDSLYKDLFDDLQLTEEQKKAVADALSERMLAQQSMGMKLLGEKVDGEALAKEVKDAKAAADEKLKAALGDPAKLEKLERYEDSQPERQHINMLKGAVAKTGEPLTQEQEEKLMATMYTKRKSFKFDSNYQDQFDLRPEKFSEAAIGKYQEQSAQLATQIDGEVSQFLSPTQMETFRQQREQLRAMEKMGMEMAAKMFGNAGQ